MDTVKKNSSEEKRKGRRKFWNSVFCEYCENTSLHGFQYIVSRDSNIVEKIIWFLVCIFGLIFSIILMLLVWEKYWIEPTITTLKSMTHPIYNLYFPAVSICNYNKVYRPQAEKFSEDMKREGLNETEIFNFFTDLPKLIRPEFIDADHSRVEELMATLNFTMEDIMYDMMQPCKKLLLKCSWQGHIYDCNKIFKPIKTVEGFCCSFNYHVNTSEKSRFKIQEFQINESNNTKVNKNLYNGNPGVLEVLNVPGAGRDMGLAIVLDLEENAYYGSIRPSVGASIIVHHPFNYPEVGTLTSFTQPNQEIVVTVSGTIMETSSYVRSFTVSRRNCWFHDEKKLNISSIYSYQTCITECRIKYIEMYCKCVPFYYPNYLEARVCGLSDVHCLRKYQAKMSSLRSIFDKVTGNNRLDSLKCTCLPSCNDDYYTSTSENSVMGNITYNSRILKGFDVKRVSLASIYFQSMSCLKYRTDSWMTWNDLLASFGGIFGLCVGGSFVSLVEFLYYCTHKIFRNYKEKRHPTLVNSPGIGRKIEVTCIDNLKNSIPQEWRLDKDKIKKRDVFFKRNFSHLNNMQKSSLKHNLQEDFVKYFLKIKK